MYFSKTSLQNCLEWETNTDVCSWQIDSEYYKPYSHHFSWTEASWQIFLLPFKVISLWEEISPIEKVFSRCCCLWVRMKLGCVSCYSLQAIISTNWEFFLPFLLLKEEREKHTHKERKPKFPNKTKYQQNQTKTNKLHNPKKHKPEFSWMVYLYIFVAPPFVSKACFSRDSAISPQINFCNKGFPYAYHSV